MAKKEHLLHKRMIGFTLIGAFAIWSWASPVCAGPVNLTLKGGTLSAQIIDSPLPDIIREIRTVAGIEVDSKVNTKRRTTVVFPARPIKDGLQAILHGLNYHVTFSKDKYPDGSKKIKKITILNEVIKKQPKKELKATGKKEYKPLIGPAFFILEGEQVTPLAARRYFDKKGEILRLEKLKKLNEKKKKNQVKN